MSNFVFLTDANVLSTRCVIIRVYVLTSMLHFLLIAFVEA